MKFIKCNNCDIILGSVNGDTTDVMCCGNRMQELLPNTVEASVEKHLPVVEVVGNNVNVLVGSVIHPMSEEHYISWVAIETEEGFQRKNLEHTSEPKLTFALTTTDKVKSVYAYCNLHGLWRTDL